MTAPAWWAPPWHEGGEADPDLGWASQSSAETNAGDWTHSPSGQESGIDGLRTPFDAQFGQLRSRDRVRDLAEVFTHQREIDAMLDMIPDAFGVLDIKFLEPTCGSGNFLVEILRRKLRLVTKRDCASQEQYEHRLLRGVASIYGIDISQENITEARARLAHVLLDHFESDANTVVPSPGFMSAAGLIIAANVVLGDTLNAADQVELCDWQPHPRGCFVRVWSYALVPDNQRDLFWEERIQDKAPVHYSELAIADVRSKKTGAKR